MVLAQILPRLLSDHFLENVSYDVFLDESVEASGNSRLNLFHLIPEAKGN